MLYILEKYFFLKSQFGSHILFRINYTEIPSIHLKSHWYPIYSLKLHWHPMSSNSLKGSVVLFSAKIKNKLQREERTYEGERSPSRPHGSNLARVERGMVDLAFLGFFFIDLIIFRLVNWWSINDSHLYKAREANVILKNKGAVSEISNE